MTTAIDIMKEAIALKERKSLDYQGSKWTEADYFPFGDESYMHMIHTKYLRMRNIMNSEEVNFEGLEDTLIDMINYCAMYAAWLKNESPDKAPDKAHSQNPHEKSIDELRGRQPRNSVTWRG